jgi:adenine-specific DNA-methyltransferase
MRYEIFGFTPETGQWKLKESSAKEAIENYETYLKKFSSEISLEEYWQQTGKTKKFIRLNPSLKARGGKNRGIEQWIPPSEGILRTSNWTDLLTTETSNEIEIGFSSPKSVQLLKTLIKFGASDNNSLILDFFAGSGTTLHALMALNAADGGRRQCILVTNNENQIAEEVCYERNRRVIEGYTKPNGEAVAGLGWNALRYYRTDFVRRERSPEHREELTRRALDMLCIKENCYDDVTPAHVDTAQMRLFANAPASAPASAGGGMAQMLVVLPSRYMDESVEAASELIASLPVGGTAIKVYVFSPSPHPYTEEFEEVLDRIELCALPEAIYKAYREILPAEESDEENE